MSSSRSHFLVGAGSAFHRGRVADAEEGMLLGCKANNAASEGGGGEVLAPRGDAGHKHRRRAG